MQQQQQKNQTVALDSVYKNRYIILAIILTGIFMSVIDSIVVNIALPTITAYFNVGVQQSQWVVTAYLLTLTSLLIIFGKVSEYTGKVNLFMAGIAIFTAGSLACGLAADMTQLILFRVLQAVGGAIVFGGSGGIIFQAFPPAERGRAMGFLGATIAIASIAGPVLGGLLVYAAGWEYIFLINVPIGIVVLAAAWKYLKISERRSEKLNMDWIGAVTLIVFMVSLVMLLTELADEVRLTASVVAFAVLFTTFLVAFLVREARCKEPLLDLSLFVDKKFTLPVVSMMISFVATFMSALIGPFYFTGVMGFNALQIGLVSMIGPAIMVVGAPISGLLYDKRPSKYYSAAGMLLSAAGFLIAGFAALQISLWLLLVSFVLMGMGSALFTSPNSTESLNSRPIDKVAIATAVSSTARNLGMTLGVTVATIMIAVQLSSYGYAGSILGAGLQYLAQITGTVMFGASALCILAAGTSLWRNL